MPRPPKVRVRRARRGRLKRSRACVEWREIILCKRNRKRTAAFESEKDQCHMLESGGWHVSQGCGHGTGQGSAARSYNLVVVFSPVPSEKPPIVFVQSGCLCFLFEEMALATECGKDKDSQRQEASEKAGEGLWRDSGTLAGREAGMWEE